MFRNFKKISATGCLILMGLVAQTLVADDRDLLRDSGGEPYFYIILDTSGSMAWTPPCSALDAASDFEPYDGMCTTACPLGNTTCAQVCPNYGCLEYSSAADLDTRQRVLVDDTGKYRINGGTVQTESAADKWVVKTGTTTNTYENRRENFNISSPSNDTFEDFSISGDSTSDQATFVRSGNNGTISFKPILPKAGTYHVFTYIRYRSSSSAGATNARIEIDFEDGTKSKYLEFDQRGTSSTRIWRHLGTFNFTANGLGQVRPTVRFTTYLPNGTTSAGLDGDLYADAVYFESLPEMGTNVCTGLNGYRCQQPLCPSGDCYAPMSGDDPTSKLFIAKSAIHEVLKEVSGVNYGFGHYDNDNARVNFKHWMYRVSATNNVGAPQTPVKTLDGGKVNFPEIGSLETVGTGPPYDSNGYNLQNYFQCNSGNSLPSSGATRDQILSNLGCRDYHPADVRDIWEMQRLSYVAKLGGGFDTSAGGIDSTGNTYTTTSLYIRDWEGGNNFRTYRVDYVPVAGNIPGGNKIGINVRMFSCGVNVTSCSSATLSAEKIIYYDRISDYIAYHGGINRFPMAGNGFHDDQQAYKLNNSCDGLEDNEDWDDVAAPNSLYDTSNDDGYTPPAGWSGKNPYSFRWPVRTSTRGDTDPNGNPISPRVTHFDRADRVPLSWTSDNRTRVMARLAPNQVDFSGATPDFRNATYFWDKNLSYDIPTSSRENRFLRLDGDVRWDGSNYVPDFTNYTADINKPRPLLPGGSTPLYGTLVDFLNWYKEWKKWGEVQDIDWICRQKFVLFLTDGDETCVSPVTSACDITKSLLDNYQIKTYVVGLGLSQGTGDALSCMAANGGTGAPFYPKNKDELVDALQDILDNVKAQARAFASASIPAVQSTAADKIYLSSFTPIKGLSVWPGRLDAFLEPLPLNAEKQPDLRRECSENGRTAGCHLWDAADKLLSQAPSATDVAQTPPDYRLGNTLATRRLFYGRENLGAGRAQPLRLLEPPVKDSYPSANADRVDLGKVLVDPAVFAGYPIGLTDAGLDLLLKQIAGKILSIKEEVVEIDVDGTKVRINCTGDPDASPPLCRYVMGDIFHANPAIVTGPANFTYFTENQCGGVPRPDLANNCNGIAGRGYREYLDRTQFRRRMLMAATNDGQLHVFDAGIHSRLTDSTLGDIDVFTNGTGLELFSYMPRFVMPAVRQQYLGDHHVFSVDGSPAVADVFIDPIGKSPAAEDREWRTVVIGGVREGGDVYLESDDVADFRSGYYALDLTMPDELEPGDPIVPKTTSTLPTCLTADYSTSGLQQTSSQCATLAGEQVPFPLELWTFQDELHIETAAGSGVFKAYYTDEDHTLKDADSDGLHDGGYLAAMTPNGRDLGSTWSRPVIGQIVVCKLGGTKCSRDEPDDLTTRWVAIFGGGMDAPNKTAPTRGTWLYMVDVESGQAIYKRQLQGAAPADPAVIDVNQDGAFDAIYMGTTAGLLYKVNLRPYDPAVDYPQVVNYTIPKQQIFDVQTGAVWVPPAGVNGFVVPRITDSMYDPFPILYTGGWPVYFPPAMFRISELNQYGGLLLLGDREDLWEDLGIDPATRVPRAITFVDENFEIGSPLILPGDQAEFQVDEGAVDGSFGYEGQNLLLSPPVGKKPGWLMNAPVEWRATGEPFLVLGITVFTFFDPITSTSSTPCARNGITYSLALNLRNGVPLDPGAPEGGCSLDNCCGRCFTIDEFTTAIHAASTVTKNTRRETPGDRPAGGYANEAIAGTDSVGLAALNKAVRDAVLQLMPSNCQYNEKYSIQLQVSRNLTGVNELARVPLMICPSDWKD